MSTEIELVTEEPVTKQVNKQLYENSALNGSEVERMLNESGVDLYGAKRPNLAILHEKPEHRVILLLKLQGLSHTEIAEKTGYTISWISQVSRQPWFRLRLTEELQKSGVDIVTELLRIETPNNIFKLVQLRDTAESEQVQAAVTMNMLDRVLGKPVQRTEHSGKVGHVVATLDQINSELKKVEEEEKRLLGT